MTKEGFEEAVNKKICDRIATEKKKEMGWVVCRRVRERMRVRWWLWEDNGSC